MSKLMAINIENKENVQFCTFKIESRLYGINILNIKEIAVQQDMTPVYHANKCISGYMNIRGQIHLVIDFRKLFDFPERNQSAQAKVILFKTNIDEPLGILVDVIEDIVSVNMESVEKTKSKLPENMKSDFSDSFNTNIISGVCKLDIGLIALVDVKQLIQTIENFK